MLPFYRKSRRTRPWQLIGCDVIAPDGELLGTIEDVVVDKADDMIRYVVVGIGGREGMGETFERVAWLDLEYSPEDEAYVAPPRVGRPKGLSRDHRRHF